MTANGRSGGWVLARRGGAVGLERRAARAAGAGEVAVRVAFAGICRTDVRAADGELGVAEGRVLGHELGGTIAAVGAGVRGLAVGQTVSVDPRLACGRCVGCAAEEGCWRPEFLGVDRDGAFAEVLVVPASAIVAVPAGLDLRLAAYVEPVAATLAIVEAGLPQAGVGVVVGRGRIAELALLVLHAHGFSRASLVDPAALVETRGGLDFAIEAEASAALIDAVVARLRPRGTLVVKSRALGRIPIDVGAVIAKELRVVGACYGSFAAAAALLASGRVDVRPLLGRARPLVEYAEALAEARAGEGQKLFFAMEG